MSLLVKKAEPVGLRGIHFNKWQLQNITTITSKVHLIAKEQKTEFPQTAGMLCSNAANEKGA